MMKWILISIISATIMFLGASFFAEPASIEIIPSRQEVVPVLTAEEKQPVKMIITGDIMLDRGVEYMVNEKGNGDSRFPFLEIADHLKEADIVFGNLEGVISDKGTEVGSIYSFRAEPEAIKGLVFAGFNVLSVANNHAFDYSREALEDCLTRLNGNGIGYVGAGFTEKEAFSPLIREVGGVKIAFLAYTDLGPETWQAVKDDSGIAWISGNDTERIKQDIKSAKEVSDVLIVSLHSGEEYQEAPSQSQVDFSRMAVEAGAELLVGHHPHVVQPNEKYQDGWIFYSLGNFVFDQGFSEETMKGQIIELLIKDNEIEEINPKEIKINDFFQPRLEALNIQD
jgi:poly-gamma-glutamate synthesis protein (capsule biosynthesis protein)